MDNSPSRPRAGRGYGWKLAGRALAAFAVLLTLLVFVYTSEDWRGHHAWAQYKQELIKRGVEMDLRKLAPPPVPDDQNFAMTPFLAPLFNFNPKPLQPGQSIFRDTNAANRAIEFADALLTNNSAAWHKPNTSDAEAWLLQLQTETGEARAATAQEVLQAVEKERPVFDELRAASRRPASRFNLDYNAEDPASILLPHLGVLNRVTRILHLRATARLALNQTNAAFADADLLISLAQAIHDEPTIISQLIRNRILRRAADVIATGLAGPGWSDEQLQNFEVRLDKVFLVKSLGKALQAERGAFGNGCFDLIRQRPGVLNDYLGGNGDQSLATYFEIAPSGRVDQEQISYQRYFDQMVWPGIEPEDGVIHPKIIDDNAAKTTNMLDSLLSCWWNNRILLRLLGTSFRPCLQQTALGQTSVDEAVTACALARFRLVNAHYPEALAVLVPRFLTRVPNDVVTGAPLQYRRADADKFILYSVGWNEKDDGGTTNANLEQGDWVWPRLPEK